MAVSGPPLGSDSWLGADGYDPGDALHTRATEFLSAAKWDVLADIASKHRDGMRCRYEDKFSIGHFNMVRRIVFEDGLSWVVRVRLPDDDIFDGREALENSKVMEIEVASMKFFARKTCIPVPKVIDYNLSQENNAGAPYILMEYIHGSVASHLRQAKSCGPQMYGTPEQDPPTILNYLMRLYGEESTGSFRLTNRDFGAHNILVNDDFDIVGVIDFDGVMAAPLEVVAQYPTLTNLQVELPGVVNPHPAAVERVKITAPRLVENKELLGKWESELKGGMDVAARLGSTSAIIYLGMLCFAIHSVQVNEKVMKSCLKMLREYVENE